MILPLLLYFFCWASVRTSRRLVGVRGDPVHSIAGSCVELIGRWERAHLALLHVQLHRLMGEGAASVCTAGEDIM